LDWGTIAASAVLCCKYELCGHDAG